MATKWKDNSEIVAGLVIREELPDKAVQADTLFPPYNNLLKTIQRGNWTIETLIDVVGVNPFTAAMEATSELGEAAKRYDWIKLLEQSHASYMAGVELEKLAKKLIQGEEVDLSLLHQIAQTAMAGQGKLIPASQIVAMEVPFILSGYKPLDDHLGGLPAAGLTVVAGATKSGKTTWVIRVAIEFLRLYKEKKITYFSIESLGSELKMRMKEIEPSLEYTDKAGKEHRDEILDRFLVHDGPVNPEQILNIAAQVENLGMVIIDFADLMISGEPNEGKYAAMYTALMLAAKKLSVPIVLLAQFNRKYSGKIPRPNYIRYTGLAEALSWMLITLWNPEISYYADEEDDSDEEYELPILDGHAYIIVWLCRGGFRIHPDESPGAIAVKFRGERGWDPERGRWFSLRKEKKTRRSRR